MMSNHSGILRLQKAFEIAMKLKPDAGGFPYFAEALRRAGFLKNHWNLPGCDALYETDFGNFAQQIPSLVPANGTIAVISGFDREKVIRAIRDDQAGKTTFPEFLQNIWEGGIVSYDVDFTKRIVIYYGFDKANCYYEESYPDVHIQDDIESLMRE